MIFLIMYGVFPSNKNQTQPYISNNFTPIIQCDHGREFDNNDLHSFFPANGIPLRFSCPHTSQQNDKAERMIRTITNTIRTLLFHGRLPPPLHTATYLLNITPTTTLQMRTPHQVLFRQLTSYNHLRVFDCLCFPNLTATTAHKLEPCTCPCVFLGYALQHRGYCCLDLESRKVIISRHVIFDESVFPFRDSVSGTPPIPTTTDSEDSLPLFPSDPTDFTLPAAQPPRPQAPTCALSPHLRALSYPTSVSPNRRPIPRPYHAPVGLPRLLTPW
ncbi:hypothetical protein V2J09_013444 [Rumex salicifolius]